jgi:mono/diheme cytochrome c family protein
MAIGIAATMMLAMGLVIGVLAQGEVQVSDPAAFYKAKCLACHGPRAEKKFDSTLPDEQLIDIVMKGKKPEKPPNMPGYADKGVNTDQAKALVEYMKQLKTAQ